MGRKRTEADQQVAALLREAKKALGMSVAFLSRMDGTTQTLELVESSIPLLFQEGYQQRQERTFCQAILDGRLPPVIQDVSRLPAAMQLPAAKFPRIRSYVSVPVRLSDGTLYGTFCGASLGTDKGLTKRDETLMTVLASAAAVVIEPGVREAGRQAEIRERLDPLIAAGGPQVVLQPIVELATGRRVGAEALSRFPREWGKTPDVVFAEAHSIGEGALLELLALERAAATLDLVGGYVAMNVSPQTLLDPRCQALFDRLPHGRVLVELSEHDPVEDYDALAAALKPLRAKGARLAIDDVGAGFSSLRHIVVTSPDVIKIDRSIAFGVATDPVLRTLVSSLVTFARGFGAKVVAEGIETADDAALLGELQVDYGQGWYWGRPVPAQDLAAAERGADAAVPNQADPNRADPARSAPATGGTLAG